MDKIIHQVRVEHWAKIPNECMNSGMSKTACAFCGAERTPMRFRADAMRNITDAPKRSKKLLNFSAESLLCNASSPA